MATGCIRLFTLFPQVLSELSFKVFIPSFSFLPDSRYHGLLSKNCSFFLESRQELRKTYTPGLYFSLLLYIFCLACKMPHIPILMYKLHNKKQCILFAFTTYLERKNRAALQFLSQY